MTNRYDQAYKLSEEGYAGQTGYQKADGSAIGSSTFDVFGKTMYDITMEPMTKLGFPELFDYFDYTDENSDAWKLYK